MQNYFECCRHCTAPKRHAGCHSSCPEYLASSAAWQEEQARERAERNKLTEYLTYRQALSDRRKRRNREKVT